MSSGEAPPLPPERLEEILGREAPLFGLFPEARILVLLSRYLSELDRWRRRINLTGALSAEELCSHALESALGASLIAHGERVVDIGSGAGFPGLPLAICRPDLSVTLVEPRGKRAAFLRHAARELALSHVAVTNARIEDVGGQTFGVATTRAVGGLERIGDAPFLEPGGLFLAWTTRPEETARDLPRFSMEKVVPIPGSLRRAIAVYRKAL